MGTVAIGLVAIFLVAGMIGVGLLGAPHSASGLTAKGSPAGSAGKSAVALAPALHVNPANVSASIAFTAPSPFPAYNTLPIVVNYTIAVVNSSIDNTTTTVLTNVTDLSAHGAVLSSTAMTVTPGLTNYTFTVDSTTLACNNAACTGLPQDEFSVAVFVGVDNVTQNISTLAAPFFVISTPLAASLVAPANGSAVPAGNVTLAVAYVGSYVAGAVVQVYSGRSLVFQHSVIELTPGIPVPSTWFVGQAGTYNYSIVMTTVYLHTTPSGASSIWYFNGTLTVITKGGTVFQNVTTWSNESLISGLSGAVAGTMLLVVGLIIGMIVALVLARLVMSRPATAPPQPWESKPGAAAANTCSVCGKSFGTPEELAAHGKSEHGMQ
jgi:hypothetical protein